MREFDTRRHDSIVRGPDPDAVLDVSGAVSEPFFERLDRMLTQSPFVRVRRLRTTGPGQVLLLTDVRAAGLSGASL